MSVFGREIPCSTFIKMGFTIGFKVSYIPTLVIIGTHKNGAVIFEIIKISLKICARSSLMPIVHRGVYVLDVLLNHFWRWCQRTTYKQPHKYAQKYSFHIRSFFVVELYYLETE